MLPNRTNAVYCEEGQCQRPALLPQLNHPLTVSPAISRSPPTPINSPSLHHQLPHFLKDYIPHLVDHRHHPVPPHRWRGKLIGLFFSASWCVPCQYFAPVLSRFIEKHEADLVLILVSMDRQPEAMKQYLRQYPRWLAIPFKHQATYMQLADRLDIQILPTLVICEPDSGRPLSAWGVDAIHKNPTRCIAEWKRAPTDFYPTSTAGGTEPLLSGYFGPAAGVSYCVDVRVYEWVAEPMVPIKARLNGPKPSVPGWDGASMGGMLTLGFFHSLVLMAAIPPAQGSCD
ncbi:thioredoxin-like-domain-containing protein [Dimargaris cristalligena]|uniref:protein-disulfide reductase n=1 Tax=Dimargaris cristalligena TaxID=215637 RepID=A0A4P9ZMS5_9FUNG|nr:thioredoxin-like-domain-containing protein [Dimargaris cristalligena]|eukprot:RKP34543.1 thioredoxin-like-domain-containing protein [Dimargaris cristalligena]